MAWASKVHLFSVFLNKNKILFKFLPPVSLPAVAQDQALLFLLCQVLGSYIHNKAWNDHGTCGSRFGFFHVSLTVYVGRGLTNIDRAFFKIQIIPGKCQILTPSVSCKKKKLKTEAPFQGKLPALRIFKDGVSCSVL